jgi:hypothetical protein
MINAQLILQRDFQPLPGDGLRMSRRAQPDKAFAAAMKMLRLRSGKALKELEPDVGVSQQAMNRWENATAVWPAERIGLYLQAIGKTRADLDEELDRVSKADADNVIPLPGRMNMTAEEVYDVSDESMAPWAEPGERIWVQRGVHPKRLEGCYIELKDGRRLIRLYERGADGYYFFRRINPDITERFGHDEVAAIHRIKYRGG